MKPAIPETGKVVKTEGDKALVMLQGGESCRGCGAAELGLCKPSGSVSLLTVTNTVGARVGDIVKTGFFDQTVERRGFLFAYVIPFVCFLAGSVAGHFSGKVLSVQFLEVFAGFASLIVAARFSLGKLKRLENCHTMVITEVHSSDCPTAEEKTEEERRFESCGVRC